VAEEFVKFLKCLRNLKNLQILSMAKDFDIPFQHALSSKRLRLPSLVTFVSPSPAVTSLSGCFPNLRHLYINISNDQRYALTTIRMLKGCSGLRTLECNRLSARDADSAANAFIFFKLHNSRLLCMQLLYGTSSSLRPSLSPSNLTRLTNSVMYGN
jgi:hypothetical protein